MSHPDEGLIHAWLDGELDAAESARIEALVKGDPAWAAAAAEARGFIAATSRIVSALDDVPANVIPPARPAEVAQADVIPLASRRRGTPWWALRAAAVLVVVAGTVVVMRNAGDDVVPQLATSAPERTNPTPTASAAAPAAQAAPAAPSAAAGPTTVPLAAARPAQGAPAAGQDAPVVAGKPGAGNATTGDFRSADGGRRDAAARLRTADDPAAERRQVVTDAQKKEADEAKAKLADALAAPAAPAAAPTVARLGASSALTGGSGVTRGATAANEASARSAPVPAIACFREVGAGAGTTPVVHRVRLTSDSTAALEEPATAGGQRRAEAEMAAPLARTSAFRVRGDTLVIVRAGGAAPTFATRVTCPSP